MSDKKNDYVILRLTIIKLPGDNVIKERIVLDLEYKDVNQAKEMSSKINTLLNDSGTFACFGPDDHGTQRCFNKDELDNVLCEFIEEPEVEKAKSTLDEIKEKLQKVLDKQHDHIAAPVYPWIPSPQPRPHTMPTVVTYMVQFPPDNSSWHWSTTGTTISINPSDSSTNIEWTNEGSTKNKREF